MSSFAGTEYINELVARYSDTVVRIAFQYVRNRHDAEDIMQEVFIALIKQPPFGSNEHLKAWIIRVTINKSKNYIKSAKRKRELPLGFAENKLTESQAEMLDELRGLPEKDRNIIYLFYYEGYSAKEIAAILLKTEKAVLMRLSRARVRLRHLLEVRE